AEFNNRQSGRRLDNLNGTVTFKGQQAKFESVSFRTGASSFAINGVVANVFEPNATYELRSPLVNLADLPIPNLGANLLFNNVSLNGRAELADGAIRILGTVNSPGGNLGQLDYRELRSDVTFSQNGFSFKNLSLRTFDGLLRTEGSLVVTASGSHRLQLTAQADDLELNRIMAQLVPTIGDRLTGQLDGRGQFTVTTAEAGKAGNNLAGAGRAAIDRGMIRNFNLVSQLLLRGSGSTVSSETTARLSPGFAKLLTRSDTALDSLRADFIVEGQRLRSENLVITTPDYTITGAGWIGFDRSTNWNGMIVLSPRVTQEVQRDYRILRYLLDRRGRLAITFRLDGTIPNVRIRLDNRALAQALRGSTARADGGETVERPNQDAGESRRWLPDALERFLRR
ncbi:MAG TPA: AsmA-like C-terminal region-containing protein, partial [Candidatus Binatus sp.]|nr:AsmA-like C-terminal region-containing protein [Candidatus Binatus sp.]